MLVAKKRHTPKIDPADWAARLKAVRDRLGLNNDQLAARLGIRSRTLVSWLYGERTPAESAQNLIKLLEDGKI